MQARVVSGGLLILLGFLLLQVNPAELGGEAIVLGIGTLFMVAYGFANRYMLLVPGAVLTGLGLGLIFDDLGYHDGIPVLLGLGGGFVAIYAIERLSGRRRPGGWLPLIPGVVLLLIGLQDTEFARLLGEWWALGLILVGLFIIVRRPKSPIPPSQSSESGSDETRSM